ncbi:MAG: rod shape-determining protein MreD [Coriobacteriales bacterium]|jgi:rod shape-determining protein MreD|nr:rod shape-determining protein MreD [Coriobacteriales bacterium]
MAQMPVVRNSLHSAHGGMNKPGVRYLFMALLGFIAILAQLIIAPNIAIAQIVPNIILVSVAINAIRANNIAATIFGFSLGLIYDCTAAGAFGLMSLILTLIAFIVSTLNKGTFTGNWLVALIMVILATFFGEMIYGVFASLVNPDLDFLASIVYKVLPTTLYDVIIGGILLAVVNLTSGIGGSVRGRQNVGGNVRGRHTIGTISGGGNSAGGIHFGGDNRFGGSRAGLGKLGGTKLQGGGSLGSHASGKPMQRKLH